MAPTSWARWPVVPFQGWRAMESGIHPILPMGLVGRAEPTQGTTSGQGLGSRGREPCRQG